MCSVAPSRSSSTRPLTETHLYASSPAWTNTVARGSRSRFASFFRVSVMLKRTSSPSASIHTAVSCGEPSRRIVATTPKFLSTKTCRCSGVSDPISSDGTHRGRVYAVAVTVLVGTRKGLFLVRGDDDRRDWQVEGPLLAGFAVYHAIRDPRDGTLYAATNFFGGGTVHRSADGGETWERAEELGLPEDSGLTLNATWHVEPGANGELWLGGDPGVLFRSDDGGRTWEPNRAVLEHETREQWNPGAGGMCLHSINVDGDGRLVIGISAAGVFRTDDGGETWEPANKGTAAGFLPDEYPEVGQCVHKVLAHPARPGRLWQQNHCGVYRSDDRGTSWERLDGNGLPSEFGFALMLDPRDP